MLVKATLRLIAGARKVRVPTKAESQMHAFAEEQSKKPSNISSSSVFNLSNEQQNNDLSNEEKSEFEPLSYDERIQNSLKEKITEQLKYNYEGEDPTPHKLVTRPNKGAVWGLGGQLILASKKVQLQGIKDVADQIIAFLELHQVKNIYLHDFHKQNPERPENNRRRYHIIGSCYSSKHCWRTATQLRNSFNLNSAKTKLKRSIAYDPIYATMTGGKHEEWCIVSYKDWEISLMTEQQRQAVDLEWKWNNQVSEETLEKHLNMKKMMRGRKRQFQDLDD